MYHRFSKLMKIVLIINAVLIIAAIIANCYIMSLLVETNDNIVRVMAEKQVIRETAIRMLEKDGFVVFEGRGMSAYFGLIVNFFAVVFLYKYARTNGAFFGLGAAFFLVYSTYIGGLLLCYVLFTGKDVVKPSETSYSYRNTWEEFIHKAAVTN